MDVIESNQNNIESYFQISLHTIFVLEASIDEPAAFHDCFTT